MSDLLERLKTEVLFAMGSYVTNLVDKGFNMTESGQWWISNHPDQYQDLLKSFLDAGTDIVEAVLTHKYRLKTHGLQDKATEMNSKIIKINREATPGNRYLACGFGADQMLPPMNDATVDELYEMFKEMVIIGLDAGVDLFFCAIQGIREGEIAIKAIRDNSRLPIIATLGFNPTPKGFRTMQGIEPTAVAKKLEELGVDIIGMQCGSTRLEEVTAILEQMGAGCSKYLIAKPNAGNPQLVNGRTVWPATTEEMAREAPNWVSAGARVIGGCCGVTPQHIAKIVTAIK